jgi:hypothetical protein
VLPGECGLARRVVRIDAFEDIAQESSAAIALPAQRFGEGAARTIGRHVVGRR